MASSIPFVTHTGASTGGDSRLRAQLALQTLVLLPLLVLVLVPEYAQSAGEAESKSVLYGVALGPLRVVDVLLLLLIAAHAAAWAGARRLRVQWPRGIAKPAAIFGTAVVLAMGYGALHGGTNFFFDWRALALGAGCYVVFALWMPDETRRGWAIACLVGVVAARAVSLLAEYLSGGGSTIVGMRIPVYDGPTLSALVFLTLLAMVAGARERGWRAAGWLALGGTTGVLVLLCFRRTFWVELGLGMGVVAIPERRRMARAAVLTAVALTAAAVALGPSFYERLASMDFTQDEGEYSQGNPDHVGEVLDAWEQVRANPVTGIGLGRSFETRRIAGWKDESVMVHNAPLHVWLKYGALGLASYLWLHAALLRWLWGKQKPEAATGGCAGALGAAVFAYLLAQFAVSLGFAPWPYSSLQSTVLTAFLLAALAQGESAWRFQSCRSSRLR